MNDEMNTDFIGKHVPDVSIIVPVYNGAKYLRRCLNCLVKQTVKNIEILVVNDGSTDGTQDIINEFYFKYPQKIVPLTQENKGVSAARNNALSKAKGTYISFIDSDDTVSLEFCEHMLWNLRKTGSDLAECGRVDIINNGKAIIERNIPSCKEHTLDMTKQLSLNKGSIFVWDKFFKKDIIDRINLRFDENIKYGEDVVFLVEYKFHCQKISFVHKNLYYYTENRVGSATSTNNNMFDLIRCMEKLIEKSFNVGRHREAIGQIGDIAAGYYTRRLFSFIKDTNPRMEEFLTEFLTFFKTYIPNWKKKICKYKARGNKLRIFINQYRLTILGVKLFIIFARFYAFTSNTKKHIKAIYKRLLSYNIYISINKYVHFRKKAIKDNDVFFVSFFGSSISDSMFYMIKSMQNDNKNIIIGTNYKERDTYFCNVNNIKATLVKIGSPEYLEALGRSKYLVLNSRFPSYFNKRDDQILLNTWHGTPLKTLGRKIKKGLSDLGNNQCQFLMSDYLSYPNEYTKKHMLQDFSLDKLFCGNTVLCGYPRNSIFFYTEHIAGIRKKLGVSNKKVFIYMPTWRGETLDSRNISAYGNSIAGIFDKLDKGIGDDSIIFVKLHQVVMNKINLSSYKHIRNFDSSYDTYQFLSIADCLITDYSSVMFDFVNAEKPIALFIYDYKNYQKTRGTYIDINSLNFEKIYTTQELISYINKFQPERKLYRDEKIIYCNYDREDTPNLLNNLLLTGKSDNFITIDSQEENSNIPYNLYLMPQLTKQKNIDIFIKIKDTDSRAVFIFAQDTFTRKTEKILKEYNKDITYIITPIKKIHSTWQLIYIELSLLGIPVVGKNIFKEDINRICRGISIGTIKNHSKYKWFRFLEKQYKNISSI